MEFRGDIPGAVRVTAQSQACHVLGTDSAQVDR
jgi:hypothetical protein